MNLLMTNLILILLCSFIKSNKETKNIYCENVKNVEDATDCFNTLLDDDYETCCFFEFKNKNKYVREKSCISLELDQFLKIGATIKQIEKNNKDIKIYSLECDKSNYLSMEIFIMLMIFLLLF